MIHDTAVVEEGSRIGQNTKIWHFAHVREGAIIGDDCVIGKDVFIDVGVVIGNRVKIQNGVSVYRGVTLEDDVFVGPHAVFTNDLTPRANSTFWTLANTVVKRGASIGANATILGNLEIGSWAMVGAGSVVTKSVAPHILVVGNPAKPVGAVCECGAKLKFGKVVCSVCGRYYPVRV